MEDQHKLLLFYLAIVIVGFILLLSLDRVQLKNIWKNRRNIWEGIWNSWIRDRYVERIAAKRMKICKGCMFFSPQGTVAKCMVSKKPCCSLCGCNLSWKARSLSSACARPEYNHGDALWKAEMSEEEEKAFEEKTGYVNKHA